MVPLHVAIGKSQLAHKVDASDFEPDEVIGVVDHTHLVGFRVAHTQAALRDNRLRVRARARFRGFI